jgi:NAD(P)-dependent dehydrogenase (short-subunit alcohol dehydrogenase family)
MGMTKVNKQNHETVIQAEHNNNGFMATSSPSPLQIPQKDRNQDINRLQDKVTLIVGGANENGRALAIALAEKGSDIALVYFNGAHEMARKIQVQVEALGRGCLAIAADSTGRDVSQQIVQKVIEVFGRLDIFITYSASGLAALNASANSQAGQSNHSMRVRIFPHFCLMKAALEQITTPLNS